jgi:hypothetical protein
MKKIIVFLMVAIAAMSCRKEEFPMLEMESSVSVNETNELKAASVTYSVSLSAPTSILIYGNSITIGGTVKDNKGKYYANQSIGVEDGIGLMCRVLKTDKNGKFSYSTKVMSQGVAIVEILIGKDRYPYMFQCAAKRSGSNYQVTGLSLNALAFKNTSTKNYSVKTSTNYKTYNQILYKNTTLTALKAPKTSKAKRVTAIVGTQFTVGAGAGGANIAVTVDSNGVGTTSVSAGSLLLRGQVYSTTAGAAGACWAPGYDLGTGPIALSQEVTLCLGTDGVSISSSLSTGPVVGGYSIQLVSF